MKDRLHLNNIAPVWLAHEPLGLSFVDNRQC